MTGGGECIGGGVRGVLWFEAEEGERGAQEVCGFFFQAKSGIRVLVRSGGSGVWIRGQYLPLPPL